MFSRILIKLIDQAIVPAIFLLTVKIVATVGISRYLGIVFTVGPTGFVFDSTADYVRISSYSTFAMVAALAIGLFYILLKSMAFHETHISPKMTAKLFSLRLSTFIQGSFDLYSQGAIWMSYSYLLMFVTGIMSIFGMIYSWVFYSSYFHCFFCLGRCCCAWLRVWILAVESWKPYEICLAGNKAAFYIYGKSVFQY